MNDKLVIKHDDNLLASAQRVFGSNLVIDAFVTTYDFGKSTKDKIQERLNKEAFKIIADEISYDSRTIVLKFLNNRMIELTNSEWATISLLKEENITVEI